MNVLFENHLHIAMSLMDTYHTNNL